jgi:threonine dehydrogenase-like Zn-dependent dehydrogenase
MPNEKVPTQVDRRSRKIPVELGESRETGSKVKGDRVFVAHRASEIACKRGMDLMCEVGQVTKVRLKIKKRFLTLDGWRK